MSDHPMYVCPRCGWGHYHPLSYCVRCPGKLERRSVPHLQYPKNIEESRAFLKTQGVEYIGEYLEIPIEEQQRITLARHKEMREARVASVVRCKAAGDLEQAAREQRCVDFWDREIAELTAKMKQPNQAPKT